MELLVLHLPVRLAFPSSQLCEIVVYRPLIYRHLQSGLASYSTSISGHKLDNLRVYYGSGHSFHKFLLLLSLLSQIKSKSLIRSKRPNNRLKTVSYKHWSA